MSHKFETTCTFISPWKLKTTQKLNFDIDSESWINLICFIDSKLYLNTDIQLSGSDFLGSVRWSESYVAYCEVHMSNPQIFFFVFLSWQLLVFNSHCNGTSVKGWLWCTELSWTWILSFLINRNMFPENLVQACFQQVGKFIHHPSKIHPSFIDVPPSAHVTWAHNSGWWVYSM